MRKFGCVAVLLLLLYVAVAVVVVSRNRSSSISSISSSSWIGWLDCSKHQTRACCSAYPGPSPSIFFTSFSPKYPYLPDLVFDDSLFQVQHRLDYLLKYYCVEFLLHKGFFCYLNTKWSFPPDCSILRAWKKPKQCTRSIRWHFSDIQEWIEFH